MSLLMYSLQKTEVVIATDTLAMAVDADSPSCFYSKCLPLPHMGMVVTVTGIAQIQARWATRLNEGLISRDVVMADRYAPKMLTTLWDELREEGVGSEVTSTIYHFGQVEESGEYVGYAYRSADGFVSERLPSDAFGIKPTPIAPFTSPSNLDDWAPLAEQVRAEQASLPPSERIYVGGAMMLTVLTQGGIFHREMHRFDDYESAWLAMNAYHFTG